MLNMVRMVGVMSLKVIPPNSDFGANLVVACNLGVCHLGIGKGTPI